MSTNTLPHFTDLNLSTFVVQLDEHLQQNLQQINQLLSKQSSFTWDNLMQPLEDMNDAFERFWSPLSYLHGVVNNKAIREVYEACLPKIAAYDSAVGQNQSLFDAIKSIDRLPLNATQIKIIEDALRDFTLSGVALPLDKKQRFEAIQTELSALTNQFENNVLDATQAFSMHIVDVQQLKGLPDHAIDTAKALATAGGLGGWVLNLEFPCYLAVMSYAEDRALRETFYYAYVTRASDAGPYAGQFDNSSLIEKILMLRHEEAQLLGFANYAQLSLATKMAESPQEVISFLVHLADRARKQAREEFHALSAFAKTESGLSELAPWDVAFYSEKMRKAQYDVSQEELRPYFPKDTVLNGLFTITERLYGIRLVKLTQVDTWHEDVECYQLMDETNQVRGYVYMDLFARPNKQGGAWMDSLQSRRRLASGAVQLPIATLTCNFAKASAGLMPTFSHDEVLTLFHEFGHCLHHLLTKVDYLSASGIHGVEWDAVELPSQFFENWCWEKSALQLLTRHVKTNEPLPGELYNKLLASKNFQSAMAMMRQLEFSLFDFRVHQDFMTTQPDCVAETLADVRRQTAVVPIADYNRFQHSFTHIFAGGYAAGYYSYKWAEVLSSDAFARFLEEGVFNEKTGRHFLRDILEVGGSKKAKDAFASFRGRDATIDALLLHNGIG